MWNITQSLRQTHTHTHKKVYEEKILLIQVISQTMAKESRRKEVAYEV